MLSLKFSENPVSKNCSSLEQILLKASHNLPRALINYSQESSFVWQWRLLHEYLGEVYKAMGAVKARGGYISINFNVEGAFGQTSVYWKNLSPATIYDKAISLKQWDYVKRGMGGDSIYDTFKDEFSIWKDTGGMQNALTITKKGFAGIIDPRLASIARTLDEGGPGSDEGTIPARPLFSAANHLFVDAVTRALSNKESSLSKYIRRSILAVAIETGLWGNKGTPDDDGEFTSDSALYSNYNGYDLDFSKTGGYSVIERGPHAEKNKEAD